MGLKEKRAELAKLMAKATELHGDLTSMVEEGKTDGLAEKRQTFQNLIADGKKLRDEVDQEEEYERLRAYTSEAGGSKARSGAMAAADLQKSWGQIVVNSPEYKAAQSNRAERMDRVNVKAIYADTDATGGAFTVVQRTEFVELPERPPSVIDLINVARTTSDAVEYVEMATRDNQAAVVPEYTAGNFGLKPESDMTFALKTAPVKTIATWVPASRQILSDAPQLRNMIDVELAQMLRITLEDQILNGDGVGSNFTGILNTAGIQTRTQSGTAPVGRAQVVGDQIADTIRRAITDIRLAYYEPNGVLMHPEVGETLALLKDGQGAYLDVYDSAESVVWRVRAIESPIMPSDKVLVGNFQLGATLWDRMQTDIRVGEPNDYFLRNAVALLAELRAAFAVKRPTAFEEITIA